MAQGYRAPRKEAKLHLNLFISYAITKFIYVNYTKPPVFTSKYWWFCHIDKGQ